VIVKERGGKLGVYSLEKRRVREEGGPTALFHYLKAGCGKYGVTIFLKSFQYPY